MGDSSITYEELFELLRRERNSEELQTLEPNFYSGLVSYLKDKKDVVDDTSEEAQMFGASERDKVKAQLENAKKIARELIERREKKIIILALNKARTNSDIIDTSALLNVEKEFFYEAATLFTSYKKGVLQNIVSMQKPVFGDSEEREPVEPEVEEKPSSEEPEPADEADDEELSEKEDSEEKEVEADPEESEAKVEVKSGVKVVKFKSAVPKFMGKDEEVYGPFEEDEVAEVEEGIAQILISKGRAEEVE